MLFDNDDHKKAMSAAMALSSRFRASSGVLLACAGGLQSMTHISSAPSGDCGGAGQNENSNNRERYLRLSVTPNVSVMSRPSASKSPFSAARPKCQYRESADRNCRKVIKQ